MNRDQKKDFHSVMDVRRDEMKIDAMQASQGTIDEQNENDLMPETDAQLMDDGGYDNADLVASTQKKEKALIF